MVTCLENFNPSVSKVSLRCIHLDYNTYLEEYGSASSRHDGTETTCALSHQGRRLPREGEQCHCDYIVASFTDKYQYEDACKRYHHTIELYGSEPFKLQEASVA